jgi:hypothetical protein
VPPFDMGRWSEPSLVSRKLDAGLSPLVWQNGNGLESKKTECALAVLVPFKAMLSAE